MRSTLLQELSTKVHVACCCISCVATEHGWGWTLLLHPCLATWERKSSFHTVAVWPCGSEVLRPAGDSCRPAVKRVGFSALQSTRVLLMALLQPCMKLCNSAEPQSKAEQCWRGGKARESWVFIQGLWSSVQHLLWIQFPESAVQMRMLGLSRRADLQASVKHGLQSIPSPSVQSVPLSVLSG